MPTPAAAQESPIRFLRQLVEPFVEMPSASRLIRPETPPAPPPPGDVPLPRQRPVSVTADTPVVDLPLRPDRPETAAAYAPPVAGKSAADPVPAEVSAPQTQAAKTPAAPEAVPRPAPPPPPVGFHPEYVADAEVAADNPADAPANAPQVQATPALAAKPGPADTRLQTVAIVPIPPPRPAVRLPKPETIPPAAQSSCGRGLEMLGVTAIAMPTIRDGQCGIAAPVAVSALSRGNVALTETAVIQCDTAETLDTWLQNHVRPAARDILGGELTGLRVAASYACRNRNSQSDTKLSEHAKGNAIDISAFQIDGKDWVVVGAESGKRQKFLRTIRKAACGPFKTVLGPGSDAFHSDHFHLDMAHRRNGSTYCR